MRGGQAAAPLFCALEWLQTALRLRDPGLAGVTTDPLVDPCAKSRDFRRLSES
jgi:hypothetical protein